MDRMHLMSMSVGVKDADFTPTYEELAQLAQRYGQMHSYSNLSCSDFNESDAYEVDECEGENLHHDENTLHKVRDVMNNVIADHLSRYGLSNVVDTDGRSVGLDLGTDLINQLQNAGIVFREWRR